jgi:hypothetical protein
MINQTAQIGHEPRDINVRVVIWFAVGLVVSAIIIYLGAAGLYRLFARQHPSPEAASRIEFRAQMIAPSPQLRVDEVGDFEKFRAAEEAKLTSYGWIDKNAGIIRIPIARAMDLIVQRGLPVRSGSNDKHTSGKTAIQMQQDKAAATKP